jgi:hypothetical protein
MQSRVVTRPTLVSTATTCPRSTAMPVTAVSSAIVTPRARAWAA